MAHLITVTADKWIQYFPMLLLQHMAFLGLILILLHIFRKYDPRLLKGISIIGLLKLFIPPVLSVPGFSEFIPFNILTLPEIIIRPEQSMGQSSILTFPVIAFFCWLIPSLLFVISFVVHGRNLDNRLKGIQELTVQPNVLKRHGAVIYKSKAFHSPFVYGLFRPKIIVPQNWDTWDSLSQKSVIEHELGHLRQADSWINLLKTISITLFYANPFVWLLIKKMNLYSEIICDDTSIHNNSMDVKDYNRCLLNLATDTSNTMGSAPLLFFSKTHQLIKQRLLYQLEKKENLIMKRFSPANIIMLITISVFVIPFSMNFQPVIASAPQGVIADSIHHFYDVEVKPILLHKESPRYPDEARKAGIQGTVVITVIVDQKGDVSEAKVFKSIPELDAAALDAASRTKFKSASHQGKAVKVRMNIPYKFKLK